MTKLAPPTVLHRLTKYRALCESLRQGKSDWVSSQELADSLGLTSSTVRQDLSYVEFSGTSKKGYEVEGLSRQLSRLLGADEVWRTVVVGAGNLGRALALHEDFARHGFHLCGLFDADPAKVGKRYGSFIAQSMERLPEVVVEHRVDIGMIAVPATAAQRVADLLIASGVRGLLNLTLTHVIAPRRVAVVDARIVASLQELAHAIKAGREREGNGKQGS